MPGAMIKVMVEHRKTKGMTQTQVATLMGTTQPKVSNFEKGKGRMTLDKTIAYLRAILPGARITLSIEAKDDDGQYRRTILWEA